jgi:hypothetical protein
MKKISKKVAKKPENVNHLFEKTVFASNIDKKSIIQVDPKKFDAKRPKVKLLEKRDSLQFDISSLNNNF